MDEIVNSFVALFIVIDPLGVAAVFSALTHGMETASQRKMAIKGASLAALILFLFFLAGETLLKALGIGVPAFRIAGGVLLLLLAIDMVFARQSGLRSTTIREQHEAEHKQDISVFPLAFPLISGPGALTTVLLMSSQPHESFVTIGMLVMLFAVLCLTLLSLMFAPAIMRILGETGSNVISRLFGLILAALAAQYMTDGIRESFFNLTTLG